MRLVDADKLIEEGWVLHRHGESNRLLTTKSIADVPTAFDPNNLIKELREEIYYNMLEEEGYFRGIMKAINILEEEFK